MPPEDFFDKYPRTRQAMIETGMDIDQLFIWSEIKLKKLGDGAKK